MTEIRDLEKPEETLGVRFHLWRLQRKRKMPLWHELVKSLLIDTHEWEWVQVTEDGEIGILRNRRRKTKIVYQVWGEGRYIYKLHIDTNGEKWDHDDIPKIGLAYPFRVLGIFKLHYTLSCEATQDRSDKISSCFNND